MSGCFHDVHVFIFFNIYIWVKIFVAIFLFCLCLNARSIRTLYVLLQKQIFLAPHRRLEEKDELQMNMERAFEDMYMAAKGH